MKPAAATFEAATQRKKFNAHGNQCIFGVTTRSKNTRDQSRHQLTPHSARSEAHRRSRLRVYRRGSDLRRRPDDPEAALRQLWPRVTRVRRTPTQVAAPRLR